MAVRCRTTHRAAPSRSVHRHHPRWGPRQYRFTAGQRCPSYRRAISDTSISATVADTSSTRACAPNATTTPTAAGAAMSAGRRRTTCAPSARRQSGTGPADDEVRDRIDVAIDVAMTNYQDDRRVRPSPVIPAESSSSLYGAHRGRESAARAGFRGFPQHWPPDRLRLGDAASTRSSGDDQAIGPACSSHHQTW